MNYSNPTFRYADWVSLWNASEDIFECCQIPRLLGNSLPYRFLSHFPFEKKKMLVIISQ